MLLSRQQDDPGPCPAADVTSRRGRDRGWTRRTHVDTNRRPQRQGGFPAISISSYTHTHTHTHTHVIVFAVYEVIVIAVLVIIVVVVIAIFVVVIIVIFISSAGVSHHRLRGAMSTRPGRPHAPDRHRRQDDGLPAVARRRL